MRMEEDDLAFHFLSLSSQTRERCHEKAVCSVSESVGTDQLFRSWKEGEATVWPAREWVLQSTY